MDNSNVTTWAALRDQLQDAGASEAQLELVRRATAAKRHEERVQAAIKAAMRAAGGSVRRAWVLLVLEYGGCGGPCGAGDEGGTGCSTARAPWASGLGKGRRQATDGPSWTTAINHAQGRLATQAAEEASPPNATGAAGYVAPSVDEVRWAASIAPEWAYAYCVRQLRRTTKPEELLSWSALALEIVDGQKDYELKAFPSRPEGEYTIGSITVAGGAA